MTLNKYLAAINKDDFSYDDQPNVFALQARNTSHCTHYSVDCSAFLPRLLLWNVFFSQGGDNETTPFQIGDDFLETLMFLRCNKDCLTFLYHRRNVTNRVAVCNICITVTLFFVCGAKCVCIMFFLKIVLSNYFFKTTV